MSTMEERVSVYTLENMFGPENDYTNSERGNFWKKQLKGCMVSAVGYALGYKSYEDTAVAFRKWDEPGTYIDQMETLLSKATRNPKLVFEVGSGRGELVAALTKFKISCVGSDPMPEFFKGLEKTDAIWGVKSVCVKADIIKAAKVMKTVDPDTVIMCETIEHIPKAEFEEAWRDIVEVLTDNSGLFIVTNWVHYHPLMTNGYEHLWKIDDEVYDWLESYAKETVYRNGSHLVLQF